MNDLEPVTLSQLNPSDRVVIIGKIGGRRNILYIGHLEILIKIIKVAQK